MSPEMETLDQLLGGAMSLQIIRRVYADDASFMRGVLALVRARDVRLLSEGAEVPRWRWRELFEAGGVMDELPRLELRLTDQGGRRVS